MDTPLVANCPIRAVDATRLPPTPVQLWPAVAGKARKIGATLRRVASELPRVDGVFLLTQLVSKAKRLSGQSLRGVAFHTLNQWKDAIGFDGPRVLSSTQVSALAQPLAPKIPVAIDGALRRLAGYVNLELQTPREEKAHRVYKGSHPGRRDRVILHLYDLSASDGANAETKARREAEAIERLQRHPWPPRILVTEATRCPLAFRCDSRPSIVN